MKITRLLLWAGLMLVTEAAIAQDTMLLRMPTVSDQNIAFVYANDIWVGDSEGQDVRRLTTFEGAETHPHLSPDGNWIAFSGQYDGNTDVYVVATTGGEPRRMTWHPGNDIVRGWTPDGSSIVFASGRTNAPIPIPKFWTIGVDETFPSSMPLPRVHNGKHSPDGSRFVYEMVTPWESEFRNYRGGQNNPIRIIDLESLDIVKLPWDGTKDQDPVWVDDTVFFLSDRDYTVNVWAWDTQTSSLSQRTFFSKFDVKNLEGGGGRLIFENGGYLYAMSASAGSAERLNITVEGDFPWARPGWKSASGMIQNGDISPNGKRLVFEARGEIFTVPAKDGPTRNLTNSSGVADRNPSWSDDGQKIAWFSDRGGEYQLVIADQFGDIRANHSIPGPTFFYNLEWAPDSRHVAFTDMDQDLWIFDTEKGEGRVVDNAYYTVNEMSFDWSPDSKWLAYSRQLENQYQTVFVYSVEDESTHAITDGMSYSIQPQFDASGKYLYFLSSVNYGLNVGWLDMSSLNRPLDYTVHAVVLANDEPSPIAPRSDEEVADKEEEDGAGEVNVRIDFENLTRRIVTIDMPSRAYRGLIAGSEGVVFVTEAVQNQPGVTLHRYKLAQKKLETFASDVDDVGMAPGGNHMVLAKTSGAMHIVDPNGGLNPSDGPVITSGMRIYLDPAAEWKQMYEEGVRLQRDLFYVENVHGLDLDWIRSAYGPMLDHVRHRADLTYLLDILGGETSIGHSFAGGGDEPNVVAVSGGLLGANIELIDGRYRIAKIFHSDPWTNGSPSPLSGPGIDAREGDVVLAVNGVSVDGATNFFSHFEHTAGKETILTLSSNESDDDARSVTVYPIASEITLRQYAWIEGNRAMVDELSDGQLAYVWLPNTGVPGYAQFNRYYMAQKHKKGAVIDERYNGGGFAADYIVDYLDRDLDGYFNNNIGDKRPFTVPMAALFGPKVMVINEIAGSGGDLLPYMFQKRGVGPLVGTRTWGGLVGWGYHPPLIDGGFVGAPSFGFFNVDGEWDVENIGVSPDVVVEEDPKLSALGRDSQLEKAVEVALELLKTEEVELLKFQPEDPIRVRRANDE